jgi:drug/metabolite transporter (DMT)-like permease
MNKKLPYLYVSLSVLLWGSSAAVIKLLLENLNNLQILFYVSLFAFIGLFIISIFQKKINIIKKYKITDL